VSERLKLEVQILDAKPNKMFPDWMTERVKFLRFTEAVQCAECGKRSKHLWTFLAAFQGHTMASLVPIKSGKVHPPLTPVCRSHMLAPEVEHVPRGKKKIEVKV
jgi:hypothetical protein